MWAVTERERFSSCSIICSEGFPSDCRENAVNEVQQRGDIGEHLGKNTHTHGVIFDTTDVFCLFGEINTI